MLLLLALSAAGLSAQEIDVSRLYNEAMASVGVVIALDSNSQPLAYGSGFFISPSAFVTNYHVIEGSTTIMVKLGEDEPITVTTAFGVSPGRDLAILRVGESGRPLPLSLSQPTIGERIVAIGNPLGLEATVSEGIVSGIRALDGLDLYQITSPISPGSSGGPVLNRHGRVIGVATATLTGGQNLNFAVPSKEVDELWKAVQLETVQLASVSGDEATLALDSGEEVEGLQVFDLGLGFVEKVTGVLYNGTQFPVRNIQIRLICYNDRIPVPIGYRDLTLRADASSRLKGTPIPPGLSESILAYCPDGAVRVEARILDYEIVR